MEQTFLSLEHNHINKKIMSFVQLFYHYIYRTCVVVCINIKCCYISRLTCMNVNYDHPKFLNLIFPLLRRQQPPNIHGQAHLLPNHKFPNMLTSEGFQFAATNQCWQKVYHHEAPLLQHFWWQFSLNYCCSLQSVYYDITDIDVLF